MFGWHGNLNGIVTYGNGKKLEADSHSCTPLVWGPYDKLCQATHMQYTSRHHYLHNMHTHCVIINTTHRALLIAGPNSESMFEDRVHDATNSKRWLNHRWNKLFHYKLNVHLHLC